ncbi:MAG: malonyl CoA-ACP transacylase [Gammaproteobacteria bacterium]|jgi:[acyl-carrier-protein] S-malonyltransferase|nr:malonyl CoA-ACP transacylase [Gammaproteobacteria bacterium]
MTTPNIAVLFPGQGSQSVGMLMELGASFPIVRDTFREASKILGYDLWRLIQDGPEEQLNQTEFTQPALLTASVAIWRVLANNLQLKPSVMAGHSLGEYSALVCAGAIDFEDAVKLVQLRGQLMQQACPEGSGAMAAIVGLSDEAIETLCKQVSRPNAQVVVANFNSIGQTVVAGHKQAVEALVDTAKAQGVKLAKLIPVSVPAHSFLMVSAASQLAVALNKIAIRAPEIPVIHNVNAQACDDPQEIRELLQEQLYLPVLWTKTQQVIASMGVALMLELGPGKVLTGLAKRTIPEVSCVPINNLSSIEALAELT